ncbi:MAG: hypothetical protein WBP79_12455, partial [Candidatus Acidiferrales bacterium]
ISHMSNQSAPKLPENVFDLMLISMEAFYGLLLALGVWWLYFFNRKAVIAQFRGEAVSDAQAPFRRPISLSILAWFLLFGSCSCLVCLVLSFPTILFGILLTGRAAKIVFLAYGVMLLFIGVGILKLKPWARKLSIWYFSISIASMTLSLALPGSEARFERAYSALESTFGTTGPQVHPPVWSSILIGLISFGVPLWLVISRKQAFTQNRVSAPPLA